MRRFTLYSLVIVKSNLDRILISFLRAFEWIL